MIMESILDKIRTKIDKLLNREIHEHTELQSKNVKLFQEALNRYHADILLESERLQYKDETYN
jgi:FtsZ-binding cell division protein ZapB